MHEIGTTDGRVAPEQEALAPGVLRRTLDPATLSFATTAEVEPADAMISQPRAADALDLGIELDAPGYNVFATGPPGSGKRSVLESELRRRGSARPTPPDWVYLHDFEAPERPAAVALAAGRGPVLARDVAALVETSRREIDAAFASDAYAAGHRACQEEFEGLRGEALAGLQQAAHERGVAVEPTPGGLVTLPLEDGRPITPEEFPKLSQERQDAYHEAGQALRGRVDETFVRLRALEREERAAHERLDREIALQAIAHPIDQAKRGWADVPRIVAWLDALCADMLDHLQMLRAVESEHAVPARAPQAKGRERYEVNVFVTRAPQTGAPVVAVHDCSYYGLFGRIDYDTMFGAAVTDHRHVRPGAVHSAAGGFLLLDARDVLSKPFVWGRLKQLLRTGRSKIENLGTQYMLFPSASLDPEPIDVGVTVVLVGDTELYTKLHALDHDVPRLFKVRADFDPVTPWDDTAIRDYAAFVSGQVHEHALPHFDRGAVARIVEFGGRLAGDRERLSTRYPTIADVVIEAAHLGVRDGATSIGRAHVERALRERRRRSDLLEQQIRERTLDGTLRVDVTGSVVGQINALAVVQTDDHAFGHPLRVSASVAPGDDDVIDIDREAELSGPIHTKGVLILAGLLRHLYAHDTAPAMRASLVFEQSYGAVEGDSASAAELFALISALSGVGLDQRFAVTGSVDQRGRIQAIGGVNEKIEGFFAICREHGLTGDQGVIVPRANVRHLMLDPEVVAAVAEARFHVWAIETIDEGLELLTGRPASAVHSQARHQVDRLARRGDHGHRRRTA